MKSAQIPPFLSLIFFIPHLIFANEAEEYLEPIKMGNFALPFSQQPGPLVSFGQNVILKGITQLYLFGDAYIGKHNYQTDLIPSLLYGITDDLSIFLSVPFSPGNKNENFHSSGFEDAFAQVEYAFYTAGSSEALQQATIATNITFPTGSISKNPPTGFGSCSFFIGATYMYMRTDWFFYTSPGAVLTTSRHRTKVGNQLLYQFGLGRNIPSPTGWIFAWQIEFDGQYDWKSKFKGSTNSNSGGNVIYITPSFWASSKNLIFQLGAGYPALQHLNGNQSKKFVSFVFNFGISF